MFSYSTLDFMLLCGWERNLQRRRRPLECVTLITILKKTGVLQPFRYQEYAREAKGMTTSLRNTSTMIQFLLLVRVQFCKFSSVIMMSASFTFECFLSIQASEHIFCSFELC
mmetsp:Transcript_10161/g.14006  ORF Transcript_10161/g.14006 Transcript_10161/m.14006 type:complete len:112 (+) Transcript_10161:359-694(+)